MEISTKDQDQDQDQDQVLELKTRIQAQLLLQEELEDLRATPCPVPEMSCRPVLMFVLDSLPVYSVPVYPGVLRDARRKNKCKPTS